MNAIQPTPPSPPPPPPLVGPCLPANDILPYLEEFESWVYGLFNSGDNKAGQTDRSLHATETHEESATPAADPIHASTPQPRLGISSHENISTPELDGGASCYPTPSTICAETPRMGEPLTLPGFGATMVSQASDTHGQTCELGRQSTTPSIANSSTQVVLHLLRSCGISLEDTRIRRILEAERHILAQDIDGMLRPLFDHWDKYKSLDLHALGLPVQWKGIQAAVDYLRVLDADERAPYLGTVARRIGQVLLYFNYEELCKYPEKYCPPSSKPNVTYVLNCILHAYPDDFRILKSRQCRRDKITGYHVRRGRWWWRLAGNLGVGILLAGDSYLMSIMCGSQSIHRVTQLTLMFSRCNNSFTNSQIKVFVTFAQKTRPGTIRVFKALEPVVKALMFGQITYDLQKVIFDKDVGLLRPEEVACVRANDERALASQRTENLWQAVDAEKDAAQKMTEFLSFRAGNVTLT